MDRRKNIERRVEDLPFDGSDRRKQDRRDEDRSRRTLMDRRISSVPVETDRRKGSRRTAEKEAASRGEEAVPDWMESVLAEAAHRQEKNPAMSPPAVDEKENAYFEKSLEQRNREQQRFDLMIVAFVILCFMGLVAIIAFGV